VAVSDAMRSPPPQAQKAFAPNGAVEAGMNWDLPETSQ
jgi:hypothetical protein